jgi:hypothetical protein
MAGRSPLKVHDFSQRSAHVHSQHSTNVHATLPLADAALQLLFGPALSVPSKKSYYCGASKGANKHPSSLLHSQLLGMQQTRYFSASYRRSLAMEQHKLAFCIISRGGSLCGIRFWRLSGNTSCCYSVLWGRINEKEAAAQLVMKLRATLRSPFDRRPAKGPGQGQQAGEAGEVG